LIQRKVNASEVLLDQVNDVITVLSALSDEAIVYGNPRSSRPVPLSSASVNDIAWIGTNYLAEDFWHIISDEGCYVVTCEWPNDAFGYSSKRD